MMLVESCCALAERPYSKSTKASSALVFYLTVVSSFCWKKIEKK